MRGIAARLLRDEHGQGMIEYALVAGALAVGMIVSIKLLGGAFGLAYGHHAKGLMRAR
ncbi:Flp family type IVb pilin [bacterium]|nr:Flp family type IVb pilin [bacterium]